MLTTVALCIKKKLDTIREEFKDVQKYCGYKDVYDCCRHNNTGAFNVVCKLENCPLLKETYELGEN